MKNLRAGPRKRSRGVHSIAGACPTPRSRSGFRRSGSSLSARWRGQSPRETGLLPRAAGVDHGSRGPSAKPVRRSRGAKVARRPRTGSSAIVVQQQDGALPTHKSRGGTGRSLQDGGHQLCAARSPKPCLVGAAPTRREFSKWGRMFHRGDAALQAACGGGKSPRLNYLHTAGSPGGRPVS